MRSLALVVFALCAIASTHATCSDAQDCASCIGGNFCGWCSPAPTVFSNGTSGSQCQDQRESGWKCNHLYSTDHCLPGYVCDGDKGQCIPGPAGKGDTKANCEATCKPTPSGLSICNTEKSTCEPCTDYCKADSDCKGSYCQGGLCHGSSCQQKTTCTETCSDDTPSILIGTWRGVQIQTGFGKGEYDMKFQSKKDGPQVMYRGATGGVSTGHVTSDYSAGGKHLNVMFTAGPLAKVTLKGQYDAWEPSPETEQMAFFFGANGEDSPDTIHQALNTTGSTTYVLSRCGHGAVNCDFDSVFGTRQVFSSMDLIVDPCNPHADCTDCIGDVSKLCGWCSQAVKYSDGTPGKQCAGFDKTGKPLGWQCEGVFSKDSCSDFGCDWTDIKNPKCMPGNGTQSKGDCSKSCVPPTPQSKCDAVKQTCTPCDMHYCTSNAQCPGSYCNIQGAGPWSCHGAVEPGCMEFHACEAVKATNCTTSEKYALCDTYAGQCKPVPAGTPGASTAYECQRNCQPSKATGTYRGVAISAGFERGEYDFTFYDDSTMHSRAPDGKISIAKLEGGKETVESGAISVDGVITKSDDPSIVGKKFYAIWKKDTQGNDDVGKFLFQGIDWSPVPSFAAAMSKAEWIMIGCKDTECDFTPAAVP